MTGYEVSQLSSSPYSRNTLVAAVAATDNLSESTNSVIFYQIQERDAATILDDLPINEDGEAEAREETKL